MSQTFEKIHNEFTSYQKQLEERRKFAKKSIDETLAEDKAILEKSGVKAIFEEIRDSGLVRLRPKVAPRKRGWLNKMFSEDLPQDTLGYVPAEIIDNGYSISLRFDERPDGCSEIRIAVLQGELNIAHGYNRVDYTPVGPNGLIEAVIDGLKNPLRISNDAYIE